MLYVFTLFSLFASTFTVGKIGLTYASPIFFVAFRMLIGGPLLLLFAWAKNGGLKGLSGASWKRMGWFAFYAVFLTQTLEFWGLEHLPSYTTCFIYSMTPFLAALLSYWRLGERLTRKKWIGLLVGMSGMLPVAWRQFATSSDDQTIALAVLAVLGAAAASTYGWVLLRQLVAKEGVPPETANGVGALLGGLMALPFAYLLESQPFVTEGGWPIFVRSVLTLIVASNFLAYNLYGYLLRRYTATFLSFAGLITPALAALFGWAILGESIHWSFGLGMSILFLGIYLFHREELRQEIAISQ